MKTYIFLDNGSYLICIHDFNIVTDYTYCMFAVFFKKCFDVIKFVSSHTSSVILFTHMYFSHNRRLLT